MKKKVKEDPLDTSSTCRDDSGSAWGPAGGGCHALEKERAKVARGLKLGLGRLFCGSEHSIFKPGIGWLTL